MYKTLLDKLIEVQKEIEKVNLKVNNLIIEEIKKEKDARNNSK